MEISEERIRASYEAAEGNTKEVLAILLGEENTGNGKGKDTRPVTERVRTFEDACRELGDEHPFVKTYKNALLPDGNGDEDMDVLAYLRLRIITAALNEGWKPKFEEDEWRYWPWYWLYKSRKDAEDDNKGALPSSVQSNKDVCIGSRLCFKTRELAQYAAKTFNEDWLTFYCL